MVDRVVVDAKRIFSGIAETSVVEKCARQAVAELWDTSMKVTAFVPVLALRRVGELLSQPASPDPTVNRTGR
jgi:hypothetical protein